MFGIIRDLHQRQMSRPFLSQLNASYTYLKSHFIISRLTWSVDMHFLFTGNKENEAEKKIDTETTQGFIFLCLTLYSRFVAAVSTCQGLMC